MWPRIRAKTLLCLFIMLSPVAIGLFAQTTPSSSAPGLGAAEPRRFAILVGIDQYADPGLVSLQKAQNDAEDLGKELSRLGGFRAVTVMSGDLPYNDVNFPSRNKILERLDALASIVRADDQVLFFFSGHGVNDRSGASILLPIDAQIKDPLGTGIDLQRDVAGRFEVVGVKNILLLVDACQKTVAKDKGLTVVGVNEVNASKAVVITATGKRMASYEDPKGGNGLFTRSILAGLDGEADFDHSGTVTVADLERYLPDAVSEYAFTVGVTQKPAVFDPGTGPSQPALVKVSASVTAAGISPDSGGKADASGAVKPVSAAPSTNAQFVSFKLPEGIHADLRLLSADGRELKVWSDTMSFSEKLEPGTYRVEIQDRSYLYYPYSTTIIVGSGKVIVPIDLKPNFGSLALSCDPADGVDVILNGEKRGTLSGSALVIERLKSGSYDLVLSRELYDTRRQTVQIEDGRTASLRLTLSPNFFTLSVTEKGGAVASIYVDGQNKGNLPLSLKLPFRDTALRVAPSDPRYKEWTDTVHPTAKGSVESRVATLVGRTGTLEVTTVPDAEAEVTLAPAGGGAGLKIGNAPLDFDALIGDYSVSAQATVNGKRLAATDRVTVREGQLSPVKLNLAAFDAAPARVLTNKPAKFAMVWPVNMPYFDLDKAGAEMCGKEFGFDVKTDDAGNWNEDMVIARVKTLQAQGYNMFSICPTQAGIAKGLYRDIVIQGGCVVNFCLDSADRASNSLTIASDDQKAVSSAAEFIVAKMGYKGVLARVLLSKGMSPEILRQRKEKIDEIIKKYPSIRLIEIDVTFDATTSNAIIYSAISAAGGTIDGLFCDSSAERILTTFLADYEAKQKRHINSVSMSSPNSIATLDAISKGYLDAAIMQNTYGEGYLSMYALFLLSEGWKPAPGIYLLDEGRVQVTKANVASYNNDLIKLTQAIKGDMTTKYMMK